MELTVKTLEKDMRSDVSEMEWYARDDVMENRHGKQKMVDGIIKQKERDDSTWRPHADCREVGEANQILCLRFERRRK